MSEGKLSAIVVSALTGVGIVMIMGEAFRDITMGFYFGVPIALVMGLVLSLFASDDVKKKSRDKTAKGE